MHICLFCTWNHSLMLSFFFDLWFFPLVPSELFQFSFCVPMISIHPFVFEHFLVLWGSPDIIHLFFATASESTISLKALLFHRMVLRNKSGGKDCSCSWSRCGVTVNRISQNQSVSFLFLDEVVIGRNTKNSVWNGDLTLVNKRIFIRWHVVIATRKIHCFPPTLSCGFSLFWCSVKANARDGSL